MLGLDISSTTVKLLELSHTGERYRVESYAVSSLPDQAVVEKRIMDMEGVANAVRIVINQSKTKQKTVAAAVSGSSVITRTIDMPAGLSEDDMETQLTVEADQYIPYPLEEINLDFQILGETKGNPESVDGLLAASRSENVEMRTAIAEIAGITTKIIDVEDYTIEKATQLLKPSAQPSSEDESEEEPSPFVIAVLDVGATMTSLNVVENNEVIYTREQASGGKQLTEEILSRYGLAYEVAGRLT